MSAKLFWALAAYALLALVAAILLTEPRLKAGVLVLMAALAAKTWIGELKSAQAAQERLERARNSPILPGRSESGVRVLKSRSEQKEQQSNPLE